MKQKQLDTLVKEIAEERVQQMLDASLRDIQAEIYKRTGEMPSTSVLSASLKRIGAKSRATKQDNTGQNLCGLSEPSAGPASQPCYLVIGLNFSSLN